MDINLTTLGKARLPRVLNNAETCAVLQRRYPDVRHVPSALNANRHSLK